MNRSIATKGRLVFNLDPPIETDQELEVWVGGPVEPQSTWILIGAEAGSEEAREGTLIGDGLYLSRSPGLLRRLLAADPPPNTRLILGCAAWGPGQLEAELHASAWLMSDVSRGLIFDTPPERMWETAIRRLGADPSTLQMSRGVH